MKQAFTNGCGRSHSAWQLDRNWQFYEVLPITSALRTQFDYERYGKLFADNQLIGMRVIEGRGR